MALVTGYGVVSWFETGTITNAGADRVRLCAMDDQKPTADRLQQSLSQLHDVLVRTPRVDDSSKRLLRDVLGDIERLLSPGAAATAPAQSQSRLEALAVEFEADHPSLSASLREFIDLLARAGL
jgi:Domain of unknown function (DUF4404)